MLQSCLCTSSFCVCRDDARQRVCLDIIHKIIALLTPVQLQELLGAVTAFVSHPSPVCRERMYDILMWIQDNYRCCQPFWLPFSCESSLPTSASLTKQRNYKMQTISQCGAEQSPYSKTRTRNLSFCRCLRSLDCIMHASSSFPIACTPLLLLCY